MGGRALRGFLMAGVVAAFASAPGLATGSMQAIDPETLARQARTLKEYRDCSGAVRVGASLLQKFPQSDAARKVDRLLDECLGELAWKEREDIAEHSPVPRLAAKALLALANGHATFDECKEAIDIFDRIEVLYPGTTEAWRAATRKANRCLEPMGRHEEARSTLERVVQRADHSPEAAFALYCLALLHRGREERDEARAALVELIRDYPADLEYPSAPGLKIVKSARSNLKALDQYVLGPFLDRIVSWLRRAAGLDRSSLGTWRDWMSLSVVSWVDFGAQIAALLLVLALLGMARLAGLSRPSPSVRTFANDWPLMRACALLLALSGIRLLYDLISGLVDEFDVPDNVKTFFWVHGDPIIVLVTAGVALVACLRNESIRRVFAIGPRSLIWVAGGAALFIACLLLTDVLSRLILRLSGRSVKPVVYRDFPVGDLSTPRAAVVTVGAIVLAAAAEECVYRGVVYEAFSRLSGRWVAAILSSILFGAMHVEPLADFAALTLLGLLLIFVRERSGGLFAPFVLHALNNFLFVLVRASR